MSVLAAEGLTRRFGGVVAVDGVSLAVGAGELHAVIGPNGAGKSTLFHLLSGHLRPDAGRVLFQGRPIDRLRPAARARLGIAITFQTTRLFTGMTVLENAMVGGHTRARHDFTAALLRLPAHRREEAELRQHALAALERVGLAGEAGRPAETLPLGQQRALQVARALCGEPRVLLLDEPAAGLRAAERQALAELLRALRQQGRAMLLVEHDVAFVTALADTVTVLDRGRVIAEGPPAAISGDPGVIAAYLGREAPGHADG